MDRTTLVGVVIIACFSLLFYFSRNLLMYVSKKWRYLVWVGFTIFAFVSYVSRFWSPLFSVRLHGVIGILVGVIAVLYMHGISISPPNFLSVVMAGIHIYLISCEFSRVLTIFPLGALCTILYVLLLIDFRRISTKRVVRWHQASQNPNINHNQNSNSDPSKIYIRAHARIPLLRIPIPCWCYTFDLENNQIIMERFGIFGHGTRDPEQFKNIQNVNGTDPWSCGFWGTFRFKFQSTRVMDGRYITWHCVPRKLYKYFFERAHF